MKYINKYITEKLQLNKDIKLYDDKEAINNNFIIVLKNYLKDTYKVEVGRYPNTLDAIGKNKDMILLTLDIGKRYLYKSIMSFINDIYPIRKECSTNNQSIYIYPDYENYENYK